MVEWDGGDEVMTYVRADYVVEEMGIDEAEVAVDGGSCSASEVPR